MTEKIDVELWARFTDKIIEQTVAGALTWEMRVTGEYARHCVCSIDDHAVWFSSTKRIVELVAPNGRRWTVDISDTRMRQLLEAIGDQLTPAHMAAAERFAREFLGEVSE